MSEPKSPPDQGGRLSRRVFLKTAGAGAAATGVFGTLGEPASAAAKLGPEAVEMALRVNGTLRSVKLEPRVTLLSALRNQLDLTGAKQVCDRGGCGACSVLFDGEPVLSCLMLAADAVGHEVTTVEALGSPERLSPLQAAFVECDALQCGFCTPGFVVCSTALLKRQANPSLEEIKDGLAGNLCRCGTYGRVFEAVQRAAKAQALAGGKQ